MTPQQISAANEFPSLVEFYQALEESSVNLNKESIIKLALRTEKEFTFAVTELGILCLHEEWTKYTKVLFAWATLDKQITAYPRLSPKAKAVLWLYINTLSNLLNNKLP